MPPPTRPAMSSPSPLPALREPVPGSPAAALRSDLSALYALAQDSRHVFASPIGPFEVAGQAAVLPRFVFFGPHASDDSWRLAFLAGFDHRDLRASRALVALATRLSGDSETGHALNLTLFPLVDVSGLLSGASGRDLAGASWSRPASPEIGLLAQDSRQRAYHGFVRIETAASGEDRITLRIRGAFADELAPGLALISPEETGSLPVRFEAAAVAAPQDGPLSLAKGLPVAPFELTVRIPATWSEPEYQSAAVVLLERFLRRYRAFQAYSQHL